LQTFASDTFFGMNQSEINVNFNLARQDGARWMTIVHTRLQVIGDELESRWSPEKLNSITRFISEAAAFIFDEKSLVHFFCIMSSTNRRNDDGNDGNDDISSAVENGIKKIFEYFEYNISGCNASAQLLKRCVIFKKKLIRQYAILTKDSS